MRLNQRCFLLFIPPVFIFCSSQKTCCTHPLRRRRGGTRRSVLFRVPTLTLWMWNVQDATRSRRCSATLRQSCCVWAVQQSCVSPLEAKHVSQRVSITCSIKQYLWVEQLVSQKLNVLRWSLNVLLECKMTCRNLKNFHTLWSVQIFNYWHKLLLWDCFHEQQQNSTCWCSSEALVPFFDHL